MSLVTRYQVTGANEAGEDNVPQGTELCGTFGLGVCYAHGFVWQKLHLVDTTVIGKRRLAMHGELPSLGYPIRPIYQKSAVKLDSILA